MKQELCGCVTYPTKEPPGFITWRTSQPCARHERYKEFPFRVQAEKTTDTRPVETLEVEL